MLAAVSQEEMMILKVIYPLKIENQKWPSVSKGKDWEEYLLSTFEEKNHEVKPIMSIPQGWIDPLSNKKHITANKYT